METRLVVVALVHEAGAVGEVEAEGVEVEVLWRIQAGPFIYVAEGHLGTGHANFGHAICRPQAWRGSDWGSQRRRGPGCGVVKDAGGAFLYTLRKALQVLAHADLAHREEAGEGPRQRGGG